MATATTATLIVGVNGASLFHLPHLLTISTINSLPPHHIRRASAVGSLVLATSLRTAERTEPLTLPVREVAECIVSQSFTGATTDEE